MYLVWPFGWVEWCFVDMQTLGFDFGQTTLYPILNMIVYTHFIYMWWLNITTLPAISSSVIVSREAIPRIFKTCYTIRLYLICPAIYCTENSHSNRLQFLFRPPLCQGVKLRFLGMCTAVMLSMQRWAVSLKFSDFLILKSWLFHILSGSHS